MNLAFTLSDVFAFSVGFTASLMVFYAADKLSALHKEVFWGVARQNGDMVPRNRFNLDRIATRKFLNLLWAAVILLSIIAVVWPLLLVISIPVALSILLGFLSANQFNTQAFQVFILINGFLMGIANASFQAVI